jgi:hypothetical protein
VLVKIKEELHTSMINGIHIPKERNKEIQRPKPIRTSIKSCCSMTGTRVHSDMM